MGKRALTVSIVFLTALLSFQMNSCRKRGGYWSKEWEEWFESTQPSEVIMDTLGIRPGMIIAEVGAGNGRLAVKMAHRVGQTGTVYANDIAPRALSFMQKRAQKEKIKNIIVVEGKVADPCLPARKLDMVYMINTYEYLARPVELMRTIIPSLKEEGVLVIIAIDPAKIQHTDDRAVPKDTILREAAAAGYQIVRIKTFLPEDNIYVFKPK
jgi:ubiquinone/menaquinone biosynthesis C-methylase UbiE